MSRISPIAPEETLEDQNRLEAYYLNLIQEQMQKKAAPLIRQVEEKQKTPTQEEEHTSFQQADRQGDHFSPADKEASEGLYSRKRVLNHSQEDQKTATKLPSMKKELSEEDKELIQRLQARDAEVRAHEMRHIAMLGQYAGSVTYDYQVGPDGRAYAIGGKTEVRDTGSSDPEASAQRARVIRQAAMAGGDPSDADLSVAALAAQSEQIALAKKSAE